MSERLMSLTGLFLVAAVSIVWTSSANRRTALAEELMPHISVSESEFSRPEHGKDICIDFEELPDCRPMKIRVRFDGKVSRVVDCEKCEIAETDGNTVVLNVTDLPEDEAEGSVRFRIYGEAGIVKDDPVTVEGYDLNASEPASFMSAATFKAEEEIAIDSADRAEMNLKARSEHIEGETSSEPSPTSTSTPNSSLKEVHTPDVNVSPEYAGVAQVEETSGTIAPVSADRAFVAGEHEEVVSEVTSTESFMQIKTVEDAMEPVQATFEQRVAIDVTDPVYVWLVVPAMMIVLTIARYIYLKNKGVDPEEIINGFIPGTEIETHPGSEDPD